MEQKRSRITLYSVQLVKERNITVYGEKTIKCPQDAEKVIRELIGLSDREVFVAIFLNTKNKITGAEKVSVGSLNSAIVSPREVFKAAILHNAASIIVGHNHPSGDDTPSREDLQVTKRLVEAGKLLDIEVLDHLIIGEETFKSLKESGMI
ncbi:RadC family protein [Ammoniphilus sp. YIM 78166]|uniref:JAB domain-containing protein n=1 Tax=Ammoniphilus sp. YIM 78166 TaxID=1644106 RepID=UPI00142FB9C3|nr:DNA repair protein RadC [Ammoniphilus sp. YIM 78166]